MNDDILRDIARRLRETAPPRPRPGAPDWTPPKPSVPDLTARPVYQPAEPVPAEVMLDVDGVPTAVTYEQERDWNAAYESVYESELRMWDMDPDSVRALNLPHIRVIPDPPGAARPPWVPEHKPWPRPPIKKEN